MATIFKQYDILLDLKRATTNNKIEVVEGDNGNVFHITLTDNGVPVDLSDTRVVAVFSNSDGTAEQDTGDTAHGEYVFVYDSVADHWNCGIYGSDDISDFGITLTGTPSNGDKVTVTYDEDGTTATTNVSGGSVSVVSSEFIRSMASVVIRGDDNNEIYILVRAGSFSSSGINECEIQIYSGDEENILVTTAKFNFQSRRSAINDETIQSEEKYPILVNLISEVSQIKNFAVTSVNGKTGDVVLTSSDVSAVPTTRKVNTKALSADITLSASDITTSTEGVSVQDALGGKEDTISDLETIRSNATNGQTAYTRSTDKVLYLSSVAISATTGDIATISDAKITADHVVVEIEFADPNYITTDVTWTTSAGSLVLNGTCSTATTANIVLIKKDN